MVNLIIILVIVISFYRVNCQNDNSTSTIPCTNGICPIAKPDPMMPGKWLCGICGDIDGEPRCALVNTPFRLDDNGCAFINDWCTNDQMCSDKTSVNCENLYHSAYCCTCKNNFIGQNCDLPPLIDDEYNIKVDIRDRPECWVVFNHYTYSWKSKLKASLIIVAAKDRINDLPFSITIRDLVRNWIFTKFTDIMTEEESERWCLTSTNLGIFCQRFNLIFNPEQGQRKERVRMIFIEHALDYIDTELPEYNNFGLTYFNEKIIGYSMFIMTSILSFALQPPYYRFLAYKDKKSAYFKDRIFNNQTGIDTRCIPKIRQLCNVRQIKTPSFPYDQHIYRIEYTHPPLECQETQTATWKVFKQIPNIKYNPGDALRQHEGCCTLTLPAYYFKIGIYALQFTMMHIYEGKKVYNSKWCITPIYDDLIKAHFDESIKLVNTEDTNTVEVIAYDINRPPEDQKKDLVYTWECKVNGTQTPCTDLKKFFRDAPQLTFQPYTLKRNWTYKFKVRVHSTQHAFGIKYDTSSTVYQKIIVSTNVRDLISLVCATCDDAYLMNPQEYNLILIRAKDKQSPPLLADYTWLYTEDTAGVVGEFRPVTNIREERDKNRFVLKIKKYVLEHDKMYVFMAKRPDSDISAHITVKTPKLEPIMSKGISCTLSPMKGIRGCTDFTIECTFVDENIWFEYYDKYENDEHLFSGRMLGYNNFGSLSGFKMTKGKIVVIIYDRYSVRGNYTMIVQLEPYKDKLGYLEGLVRRARQFTESNQFDWPCTTSSSVADVMEQKMNPLIETVKAPVLVLRRVRMTYILGLVKLVLSSLKIVLNNTASKYDILEEDAYLTKSAADTLVLSTLKLINHQAKMTEERVLTPSIYYDMIKVILDCIEILIKQKNHPYRSKPEEYVMPDISYLVKETSIILVSVLDTISSSLTREQIVGDSDNTIVSTGEKLVAHTKADFANQLSNWTNIKGQSSIFISSKLVSSIGSSSQLLVLQYIKIKFNPFWWAGGNIVTEVFLVSFCQRRNVIDCQKLTRYRDFVAINLNVIEPLDSIVPIEGTAHQVDPKTTDDYKALQLTVYRFFLPKRAKFFMKFIFNGTQEYRVMLVDGMRPDYDTMIKSAKVINNNSPEYLVPYDNRHENDIVYFMGVLPNNSVSVGQNIPFRLKAYYSLCNTWVRWQWSSFGCWVGAKTDASSMQCDCDHLSVVAGAMTTPEHNLSTISEFLLFLTPWENFLPLFITILLILLYLLLLIWAIYKDKRDRRRGEVIVLDDNFPGEKYAYLLGVHTGSKFFSGTSAAVGVRILGDIEKSRSHILRSPERSVLNTFSEDWFLIYTHHNLGRIHSLWVWHDDNGRGSDWFVQTVVVYDLQTKIEYIFEFNTWLAMEVGTYPDVFVAPVKAYEYFSMANVFRKNFENGMKDTNIWASVCLKHPRNPVSRVVRVSAIACFCFTAMAACLLLYLLYYGLYIDEDIPSYYLMETDLLIFIMTYFISLILACMIVKLFRKSFTHKYEVFTSPRVIRMSQNQVPTENQFSTVHESTKYQSKAVPWRSIQKMTMGASLLPVRLPGSKSDLIIRKIWFFAAWVFCIFTISICILVTLLFAWKLPTVKDNKFITVFLGVVIFDALAVSFFKVLIFSVVLSFMFQNILPGTTYHIRVRDGNRHHFFGDVAYLANLLEIRKQNIYYPLSESVREDKRQRRIRVYKWSILLDFLMVVVLVFVISIICNMYNVNRYISNSHTYHMMTSGDTERFQNISKVLNRTEYYDYLEESFVNRLHRFMWYNYDPLSDPESKRRDWSSDCVTRLFGNIRMRQLRVHLDDSQESGYFKNYKKFCAHENNEAKDVYATGWLLAANEDTVGKKTTCRYTEPTYFNSSRFYDFSGTKGWLDHMTRAVFVELTLYNVNTKLFTHVVLATDHLPTGQYITLPKVESVSTKIGFDLWNVGFIVFQMFFLFRVLYFMNRKGVFTYLSSFWNKCEVFLLVLGFGAVILYTVNVKTSSDYVEDYLRRGLDEFFNFFEIIKYDFFSKAVICLLFLCLVMKLILTWRFGRIYFSFYYTFLLSWSWIVWLTLYFIICLVSLRFISNTLNTLHPYYSIAIWLPTHFRNRVYHDKMTGRLVVYGMSLLNKVFILLFIALFRHFYGISRHYNHSTFEEVEHFNYARFFKSEIKRVCRRKKQLK